MQSEVEFNQFLEDLHALCIKYHLIMGGGGSIEDKFIITFRRIEEDEFEPSNGSDVSEGSKGE